MINLSLMITNPWAKYDYQTMKKWYWKIGKTHGLEIQITKNPPTILDLGFAYSFRGVSHAGLSITLGLLGCEFYLEYYDSRHWDSDADCWENDGLSL